MWYLQKVDKVVATLCTHLQLLLLKKGNDEILFQPFSKVIFTALVRSVVTALLVGGRGGSCNVRE